MCVVDVGVVVGSSGFVLRDGEDISVGVWWFVGSVDDCSGGISDVDGIIGVGSDFIVGDYSSGGIGSADDSGVIGDVGSGFIVGGVDGDSGVTGSIDNGDCNSVIGDDSGVIGDVDGSGFIVGGVDGSGFIGGGDDGSGVGDAVGSGGVCGVTDDVGSDYDSGVY